MRSKFFIPIFIGSVFLAGTLLYIYNPSPEEYGNPKEEEPVFCTMDAKLCPDGSYVGRVPPNCEFEACPSGNSDKGKTIPEGAIFEDGTLNP